MLFLITILCFGLINMAPYDAVDAITTPNMSNETVQMMKEKYGYDKPIYIQYLRWLGNISTGNFGYSIVTHANIGDDLMSRVPATIQVVLPAYFVANVLAIFLGLLAGSNKNKLIDKMVDGFCSIGMSVPTFWFAMILMYILGYQLKLFPLIGMHTIGLENSLSDYFRHFFMPFIVLTFAFLPDLTRYIRGSTLGQLKEDYVLVQKAFGNKKSNILIRHVSKNVLLPIITKMGMALPMLVTGAIITETIFGWPGVGPYFIKAVQGLDYPVIMAVLILSSTLVILGNLLSDIIYSLTDPRIKEMR